MPGFVASRAGGRVEYTRIVSPSFEMVLGAAIFASALVFIAAFRFAVRIGARGASLPVARVRAGGARWLAGARRQRAVGTMSLLQAGFVALGITSVFVMVVCAVGIAALMIAS
jgi:hypothetical protein